MALVVRDEGWAHIPAETWDAVQARIVELEGILVRINEHADVMRNQVGTGPLVSDIRHGFETIIRMTREANSK